jgi:hypothetical protein
MFYEFQDNVLLMFWVEGEPGFLTNEGHQAHQKREKRHGRFYVEPEVVIPRAVAESTRCQAVAGVDPATSRRTTSGGEVGQRRPCT